MDLIANLIQEKQTKHNLPSDLTTILNEIIKYQKLSHVPRFKQITANLYPLLAKAVVPDNDYQTYLLLFAISIINNVDSNLARQLQEKLTLPTRKLKQIEIIYKKPYTFKDIAEFDPDIKHNNFIILRNHANTAIVEFTTNNIVIYTGIVEVGKSESDNFKFEPFVYHNVSINVFSRQGNNDFNFATYKNTPVSMPNRHILKINDKVVELTTQQQQMIALDKDLTNVAKIIQEVGDNACN